VQHFMLSYILEKNGLSIRDVIRQTMGAQPAAQSFVTGQNDAAVTYEPYLSTVRAKPDAGKILVTTKDYPVVIDTLVFRTDFIQKNPKAARDFREAIREAVEYIKSNEADARKSQMSYLKLPEPAAMSIKLPTFAVDVKREDMQFWVDLLKDFGVTKGTATAQQVILP